MNGRPFKGGYGTCDACKKALYNSRKEAKRWARARHPSKTGLNAYYCPLGNGWHYGSLPPGGREQARRSMRTKIKRHKDNEHSKRTDTT